MASTGTVCIKFLNYATFTLFASSCIMGFCEAEKESSVEIRQECHVLYSGPLYQAVNSSWMTVGNHAIKHKNKKVRQAGKSLKILAKYMAEEFFQKYLAARTRRAFAGHQDRPILERVK